MSKPKLTQWYPGNVKPVRVGVYQRDYGRYSGYVRHVQYCLWDGKEFRCCATTANVAANRVSASATQDLEWRGVQK